MGDSQQRTRRPLVEGSATGQGEMETFATCVSSLSQLHQQLFLTCKELEKEKSGDGATVAVEDPMAPVRHRVGEHEYCIAECSSRPRVSWNSELTVPEARKLVSSDKRMRPVTKLATNSHCRNSAVVGSARAAKLGRVPAVVEDLENCDIDPNSMEQMHILNRFRSYADRTGNRVDQGHCRKSSTRDHRCDHGQHKDAKHDEYGLYRQCAPDATLSLVSTEATSGLTPRGLVVPRNTTSTCCWRDQAQWPVLVSRRKRWLIEGPPEEPSLCGHTSGPQAIEAPCNCQWSPTGVDAFLAHLEDNTWQRDNHCCSAPISYRSKIKATTAAERAGARGDAHVGCCCAPVRVADSETFRTSSYEPCCPTWVSPTSTEKNAKLVRALYHGSKWAYADKSGTAPKEPPKGSCILAPQYFSSVDTASVGEDETQPWTQTSALPTSQESNQLSSKWALTAILVGFVLVLVFLIVCSVFLRKAFAVASV